jgi:replicative DNA helicase
VNLAKQRHGPTGKVELFFEAEFTRFANLDRHHGAHDAD